MATDQILKLPDDAANTGRKLDASELTVSGNVVERERVNIADPTDPAAIAAVKNAALAGTEYGEVVRVASMPPASISNFPAIQPVSQSGVWSFTRSIVVSSNNSTTTPLAASATFTGTADDITTYAQINIEIYGRPSIILGDGSVAQASFFFEFSPDGTHWDVSVPSLIRDPGLVIPIPLINVGRYFRVRYLNDGGASAIAILGLSDVVTTPVLMTTLRLNVQLLPFATKALDRTIDQGVSGSDPVELVRAVLMGKAGLTYKNVLATAAGALVVDTAAASFQNISTATTTTLKSGAGRLSQIIINTAQLGSQAVVYDSTTGSGTKIATIDLSNSAKALNYNLDFANGLTVVTTGSVPADITVQWT